MSRPSTSTPTPRAARLGRLDDDPAVAAAEIVDDVAWPDPREAEHLVDDLDRGRDERHSGPPTGGVSASWAATSAASATSVTPRPNADERAGGLRGSSITPRGRPASRGRGRPRARHDPARLEDEERGQGEQEHRHEGAGDPAAPRDPGFGSAHRA